MSQATTRSLLISGVVLLTSFSFCRGHTCNEELVTKTLACVIAWASNDCDLVGSFSCASVCFCLDQPHGSPGIAGRQSCVRRTGTVNIPDPANVTGPPLLSIPYCYYEPGIFTPYQCLVCACPD
jgi:hypothetical protein